MPSYEVKCSSCNYHEEYVTKYENHLLRMEAGCPECHEKLEQTFGPVRTQMNGYCYDNGYGLK